jgi:halogenation protein CepH
MTTGHREPEIAIVGGGPAGAVAATMLADAGRRVAVFEREAFPRYHIGESLLSATVPIFDALGVTERLERHGFVRKPGGTFLWGRDRAPWTFAFREDPGGRPYAFHVIRSEFDQILLDNARAHGADVHEEHAVTAIDVGGPTPRLSVRRRDGREREVRPRLVVDASGQQGLLGRHLGIRRWNPFFKNLALWGYFRNATRLPAPNADNILSAAFDEGWIWCIPLHDGTMSVGAVVDRDRQHGRVAGDPAAALARFVARSPIVVERLARAELVSPVRVIRDYSYDSARFTGPGHLLAGDAACFIDPVFSTGVHLACLSGTLAARAGDRVLRGEDETAAFADYEAAYRGAYDRYLRFLYFFYDHHADADSYFWQARRLLEHQPDTLDARTAFVRLVSGGADRDALGPVVSAEQARWAAALDGGRPARVPGNEIFRAARTTRVLDG